MWKVELPKGHAGEIGSGRSGGPPKNETARELFTSSSSHISPAWVVLELRVARTIRMLKSSVNVCVRADVDYGGHLIDGSKEED